MLYCNHCGQCALISRENFIEYAGVSGTETRYLDPINGEVVDYGDMNTDNTGDSEYQCPNCDSSRIDFEWNGTEEEAFEARASYEKQRKEIIEEREKEDYNYKVKDSDWDLDKNLSHKEKEELSGRKV